MINSLVYDEDVELRNIYSTTFPQGNIKPRAEILTSSQLRVEIYFYTYILVSQFVLLYTILKLNNY